MLEIYQNIPSYINPIILTIGTFSLRWYSLGYLLAFATVLGLVWWRINKKEFDPKALPPKNVKEIVIDVFLVAIIGMIIGARLGYFLFYSLETFWKSPLEIIVPGPQGFFGFSFHGGLIGVILAVWIYCKKKAIPWKPLENLIVPAVPLGLFWGRLGNFMNGELFGNETTKFWGMKFISKSPSLQHPSQLYEALGEGVILFVILWSIRNKNWAQDNFLSLFLIFYGLVRFFIEFFRSSPSEHIAFNLLTTGQILCIGMIAVGAYLFKPQK